MRGMVDSYSNLSMNGSIFVIVNGILVDEETSFIAKLSVFEPIKCVAFLKTI